MALPIADRVPTAPSPTSPLDQVRERIATAAARAGRDPADITLIAVSKRQPAEAVANLIAAGHRSFGENRVAEAAGKFVGLRERTPDLSLHLVGQLQSNKAEDAASLFDAIHSVDRSSLVRALATAGGPVPPCFLQVNIDEEPQKGGCAIEALGELLAEARESGLPVVGLMSVPPADIEPAPFFALTAELAARHGLTQLSMGMSGDFETAIALGATHVRVGTALFGERA